MKKTIATIPALIVTASLTSYSGSSSPETTAANVSADTTTAAGADTGFKQGGGRLMVYSPNSEGLMNATIPLLEEKYGVDMGVIQAGTGELVKRTQSEREDPYTDVLLGGSWSLVYDNKDLWKPYVSVNDDGTMGAYKSTCGLTIGNVLGGSCLTVNANLIGDIKIDNYADLLNPELRGKIATCDPADSSSAFTQLTNILLTTGGCEDDGAWKFVEDLFTNIDGKICGSSSAVYKEVADGEYVVKLSCENPCTQLVHDGALVEVVHLTEGVVYLPISATIIRGAKNMDNAKLFIDFIVSEEVQSIQGITPTNRPALKDAETSNFMTPMSEIHVIKEGILYVSEHKKDLVSKYAGISTDIESSK